MFSSKATNLDGLWVNGNNAGLVYDLNGKKSKHIAGYTEEEIKEISTGKKARKKFEANLEKLSDSKLKTIAEFDKKYQLQTKEVILVTTEDSDYYNLIRKDGTNFVLGLTSSELAHYGSKNKDLKKSYLFHKAGVPKVFVGKWKTINYEDESEGEAVISENGVMTTDSDDIDILIAKPLNEYLMDKSGRGDNSKVQKEFAEIQKFLKSDGYQGKSVNDIYHDEKGLYYFLVVNGGKRIIVLEDGYDHPYSGYLEREGTR